MNIPPPVPRPDISVPTLADALSEKEKVKRVFRKYGKDDPYKKKDVPEGQWEGDNQT